MSLSQMQVFNKYFMPAIIETLDQMVAKFNAASNGSIRLTTEGFDGDFLQESFFASIHSAQRRVDRYAAQAAAAATDLTQQKHSSVKIAGGFGPIRYEPSQDDVASETHGRGHRGCISQLCGSDDGRSAQHGPSPRWWPPLRTRRMPPMTCPVRLASPTAL